MHLPLKLKRQLPRSLPLLMLVFGITVSLSLAYSSYQRITDEAQTRIKLHVDSLEHEVLRQFEVPLRGLMGLAGFFNAVPSMDRERFRAYWANRDVAREFPGVRGFGYIQQVQRTELARFTANEKNSGAADFAVKTQGDAAELFVIRFVEPIENNRAARGLDVAREPVRHAAVIKALQTGQPVLSGTVTLVQDNRRGPGFLYLMPLTAPAAVRTLASPQRRAPAGLVYSPIVLDDILANTLSQNQGLTDFQLFDDDQLRPDKLIYDSRRAEHGKDVAFGSGPRGDPRFKAQRSLNIGGHPMLLVASSSIAFESGIDTSRPLIIGAGGSVLTLLISLSLWLLARGKSLAEEKARLLSANMVRLARVAEHTSNSVVIADENYRIEWVNDAFVRITGYQREEANGKTAGELRDSIHTDRSTTTRIHEALSKGQDIRVQTHNLAKDGRDYWLDADIHSIKDENGVFRGYVAVETDITATKRAEAELQRERLRLENVILGTNVGIWETNLQTGESIVDQRWAEMLGYQLDELRPFVNDKAMAMVHPDDFRDFRDRLVQHIKGQVDFFESEHRVRHKDGHWVWVLSRGKIASRTPDGRAEWFAGTHMEVSERHALFDKVRESSEMLSAIVVNLPCGLSVFDADLHLVLETPLYRKLLGLPDSLFASPPVRYEDLIRYNVQRGEFTQSQANAIIQRARRPVPHRVERLRPNGVTLEIRNEPMRGGGLITTYTDITEQKKAEVEAHRSDLMLRASIDALDEAFVMYDPQDRLVLCNQRYKDVYPIAAQVMQPGKTFEEIVRYGAERGEYKAAIGRVDEWLSERMRVHRAADTDVIQELENGTVLRILERKTPEGYIVGFRIDVTDLVRAKEAAEVASRSKSQFLANMSHEIRTPMNAILGMLNLLQSTALDSRQLDYVGKTEGAAKSLLGLLNDILDFSKVEAGKMTLEKNTFRMDQLMRDLGVILSASTGDKHVEILFDLDQRLPVNLIGDSLRLKQVLINLGGNAIKFTEQGEVVVRIRVIDLQPQQAKLEFSVRDTGIGIARENIERIFEGFTQAEASTTRRFGGTGLGLTISSRLVGLMGGQLELDSEAGKGSNFHFTITLGIDTAANLAPVQPTPEDLRQLSVLIIDDNPAAIQIMRAMVTQLGWKAEFAQSGEQALACLEERAKAGPSPFQAVFVDWQMPGMDGWETSRKIRHAMAAGNAPILVMVTAHGREMLMQRSEREQSLLDGYLVKPVTSSMLFDAVMSARLVKRGEALPPTARQHKPKRLAAMRVLVVEDNKLNQLVAQELLVREGALVTLAANGQLGVQAVVQAEPPFDAVLMDVQMPVMDGYAATRAIRQLPGFQSLPIIAITANAMASDRQESLDAGMNDHVGKPFDLDHLVQTLLATTHYTPPLDDKGETSSGRSAPAAAPTQQRIDGFKAGALDVNAALERMGGDINMYITILQSFAKELDHLPKQLANQLRAEQGQDAQRLLHTLKGTAATVGAQQLSSHAAQAEAQLKAGLGADRHIELLHSLARTIGVTQSDVALLLQRLHRNAGTVRAAQIEVPLDRPQLLSDLRALLALLNQSDMASLELFSRLQARHGTALQPEIEILSEAMAGLDFALAATQCETLIDHHGT
jgi:PAS domain S-box-containing protein